VVWVLTILLIALLAGAGYFYFQPKHRPKENTARSILQNKQNTNRALPKRPGWLMQKVSSSVNKFWLFVNSTFIFLQQAK